MFGIMIAILLPLVCTIIVGLCIFGLPSISFGIMIMKRKTFAGILNDQYEKAYKLGLTMGRMHHYDMDGTDLAIQQVQAIVERKCVGPEWQGGDQEITEWD
jgi:hypothetical protein